MVRVGLIGMGFMGRMHFGVYRSLPTEAKIVAICDVDPQRAQGDLSTVWGNINAGSQNHLDMTGIIGMTDYRQMPKMAEVDMIDVCVPTRAHSQIVVEALEAGKHVLCEKPLSRTRQDANAMIQASDKSKGYLMPAMCMRFWPQWAWLKQAVDENRYGKVLTAKFQRLGSCPPGWYQQGTESGGAALDLHIHDTDFIRYCFGDPSAVSSRGADLHSGAIDYLVTHYHYDHIPCVTAEGGWMTSQTFGFRMRFSVNFEHATVDFDLARDNPLLVMHNGETQAIDCGNESAYKLEIQYFLSCINNQTPPSMVTALDGARSVALIDAEMQSVMNAGARVAFVP